jgi:lipopolysaccharide export system permease protein
MLQNKIYQNFLIEIFKTFFVILIGLSVIALAVRAVSFLDLIVNNGYPVSTYFQYSLLNLFGIAPKFIPLSFLLALTSFIYKHEQDSEFVILWTSGVKKLSVVNVFFFSSIVILIFYILLSAIFTPLALNKSRQLLSEDKFNSFLPTIRKQQFSDTFKGFTFFVENKYNNELQNIFLHDKGNNLKSLSSNISTTKDTTILAETGLVNKKQMILFNGQIISSKKDYNNEIIKFEQLNVDLTNLSTSTIKKPKLQETSTLKLLSCFKEKNFKKNICKEDLKREIVPTLNRRIVLPFYIPVISLLCSLLLFKSRNFFLNKILIFLYSFILLLFTELALRYTGMNNLIKILFIVLPFILLGTIYSFLTLKFSNFIKIKTT